MNKKTLEQCVLEQYYMQLTTTISLEPINELDHKENTNKTICMTEKTYFTSLMLQHHKQKSKKIMSLVQNGQKEKRKREKC